MATHSENFAPAVLLTEDELLALFDRGAGIDRLVERLIDILDANEPDVDLEDGVDAELDYEGEATLGAPEQHHNQSKWSAGQNEADGELELSLGAPEKHPWLDSPRSLSFGSGGYYVARGGSNSQLQWAQGSRKLDQDEGEAEPGYDLPEGDDERDGEGEDKEPSLGWAANMSQLVLDACEDGDSTAPERHGMGFVRCGPDDLEMEDEGDVLDRGEGPDDNGIADMDGANEQWSLVWGGGFV